MAEVDYTAGQANNPMAGAGGTFLVEQRLDFSETTLANADVAAAINVYPGWFVHRVVAEVETPEGGAATFDVGDGADPNGFIAAANANATGYTAQALTLTEAAPNTVTGYSDGKLYTVADTIDLAGSTDLDGAVIVVRAVVTDFSGRIG